MKQLDSTALSVVQEVLAAIRVVKAFSREDYERERFVGKSQQRLRELLRVQMLQMNSTWRAPSSSGFPPR